MIIRAVRPPDRTGWEELFREYAEFYSTRIPDGGMDRVWGWIFDPANPFWCKLALDAADTPVGFTQYQLMHRSLAGSMVCYLSDLYVTPAARGRGTGKALIDHVMQFARRRGLDNVRWLTRESNHRAREVYDVYAPRSDFILYSVDLVD